MHYFDPNAIRGFKLTQGEELVYVIRKHWIVKSLIITRFILWAVIVPLLLFYFVPKFQIFTEYFNILGLIILIAYSSFSIIYFITVYLNSEYDLIIITDDRAVDVSQESFFHRNILETRLVHIQDAIGDVKGLTNTLLHKGDVSIHTASDAMDLHISDVPEPGEIARMIFEVAQASREEGTDNHMQNVIIKKEVENKVREISRSKEKKKISSARGDKKNKIKSKTLKSTSKKRPLSAHSSIKQQNPKKSVNSNTVNNKKTSPKYSVTKEFDTRHQKTVSQKTQSFDQTSISSISVNNVPAKKRERYYEDLHKHLHSLDILRQIDK